MAGVVFLADVNVLVANYSPRHVHYRSARAALNAVFDDGDCLGLCSVSMTGAVRILSSLEYRESLDCLPDVTRHFTELASSPSTVRLEPGDRHWVLFREMIDSGRFGYKKTTDAWFAALAIERGATLMSFDGGFAQFEPFGLSWRHLKA